MSRHGYAVHVRSQRTGPFTSVERGDIYSRIRAAVRAGKNDVEIARQIGISERTVARFRRREGYVNPRAPRRDS